MALRAAIGGHLVSKYLGVSMTVRVPDEFTSEQQAELMDALMTAAGCRDDHHQRSCPVESMATCIGSSAEIYLWQFRDSEALDRVKAISPEDHATRSRDYGRGFADALHRVAEAIADEAPLRAELEAEDHAHSVSDES